MEKLLHRAKMISDKLKDNSFDMHDIVAEVTQYRKKRKKKNNP